MTNHEGKRTALLLSIAVVTLAAQVGYAQTTYSTIYSFQQAPDGGEPNASLVIGPQGSLFGTSAGGGELNYGTVFELTNPTGTQWIETVIYSFSGPDGAYPQANLVFGPNGALYGTTEGGGIGGGTIFELAPPSGPGAPWTESVLYSYPAGTHVQVSNPLSAVHTHSHYGGTVSKESTLEATRCLRLTSASRRLLPRLSTGGGAPSMSSPTRRAGSSRSG